MNRRLDFAPEGAEAYFFTVEVLDNGDARRRAGGCILIIGNALLTGFRAGQCVGVARTDGCGFGVADDWRQVWERADQRFGGKAGQPPFGRDNFQCIANRWRVDRTQRVKDGFVEHVECSRTEVKRLSGLMPRTGDFDKWRSVIRAMQFCSGRTVPSCGLAGGQVQC
jgi:hypothetical protein